MHLLQGQTLKLDSGPPPCSVSPPSVTAGPEGPEGGLPGGLQDLTAGGYEAGHHNRAFIKERAGAQKRERTDIKSAGYIRVDSIYEFSNSCRGIFSIKLRNMK